MLKFCLVWDLPIIEEPYLGPSLAAQDMKTVNGPLRNAIYTFQNAMRYIKLGRTKV